MADTYKIGTQVQHEILNPSGNGFLVVWDVPYTVTSGPGEGSSGMIQVPESNHNAEYVDRVIRQRISHIGNIAGLGSEKP